MADETLIPIEPTQPQQFQEPIGASFFETIWGFLPLTRWRNTGRIIQIKVLDDVNTITTGDGKIIFMIPPEIDSCKLVKANAFVSTVSSSGLPTIQIRNVTQAVDCLTTSITIDANEFTSITAATPSVIDTTIIFRSGDFLAVDVDVAGTGAKGLGVNLSFQ